MSSQYSFFQYTQLKDFLCVDFFSNLIFFAFFFFQFSLLYISMLYVLVNPLRSVALCQILEEAWSLRDMLATLIPMTILQSACCACIFTLQYLKNCHIISETFSHKIWKDMPGIIFSLKKLIFLFYIFYVQTKYSSINKQSSRLELQNTLILPLQRCKTRHLKTWVSCIWNKTASDGEASVLEFWGMWSTPSLLLFPVPLRPRVIVPV